MALIGWVGFSGFLLAMVTGLSGCVLKQPPFPTTPAQAEALDRVIGAVREDLIEYRDGHTRMDLATVEYILGRRDLAIRRILNDEQWSDYLAVQKFWRARSLQNEFRKEPPPGIPSIGPSTPESPES